MNKALLSKWAWRFGEEDNSAWKNVISLKYESEEGGWFLRTLRGNAGLGLWKGINAKAAKLKQDCVWGGVPLCLLPYSLQYCKDKRG